MATGKDWTLTDKRLVDITDMLKRQHTIGSIAIHYGISAKTITKQLKAHKVDHKAIRMSGISNLRAKMFEKLNEISKPSDFVHHSLKVLDKYDKTVEVEEIKTVDTDAITKQIMDELNG